jgi:hypothetical protein
MLVARLPNLANAPPAQFLDVRANRPSALIQRLGEPPMIAVKLAGSPVCAKADVDVEFERPVRQETHGPQHLAAGRKPTLRAQLLKSLQYEVDAKPNLSLAMATLALEDPPLDLTETPR